MNIYEKELSQLQPFTTKQYQMLYSYPVITDNEYDNDDANYLFQVTFIATEASEQGVYYVIDLYFTSCETHGFHIDDFDFRFADEEGETLDHIFNDDAGIEFEMLPKDLQSVMVLMADSELVANAIKIHKMNLQPSEGLAMQ